MTMWTYRYQELVKRKEIDPFMAKRGNNDFEASRRVKTEFLLHFESVSSGTVLILGSIVRILHPFCEKGPWFHSENLQFHQKQNQKFAFYLLLILKRRQRELVHLFLQTQFNKTSIGIFSLATLHECCKTKPTKIHQYFFTCLNFIKHYCVTLQCQSLW